MVKWIAVILVLLFVYHVREVFPPFIVGGIIAYLLFPLVTLVHQRIFRWMSPGGAVALIYLMTAAVVGVLVYKLGPTLADQIQSIVTHREEIATKLVQSASDQLNLNLNVPESAENLLKWLEETAVNSGGIAHFGGLLSHSLLDVLVCIVSSIYFILHSNRVGRFFLRFVPEENRTTMVNMIGQMNLMLSKYVVGQLILIALMSTVAFGFLTFFKIKYALLVAILSGCFEIIPVLGPFIAISIAVIVAVSQHGISLIVPEIIACYMIARWLEDYLVVPNIIGHAVELHPLAVIFAVLVGETMAGALGMLIAIPVAASVKVVIDTIYPPESYTPHPHHEQPNLMGKLFSKLNEPTKNGDHDKVHEATEKKPEASAKKPEASEKKPEAAPDDKPKASTETKAETASGTPTNGSGTNGSHSPDANGSHSSDAPKLEMQPESQTIHTPIDPAQETAMPAKREESA